MKKYYYVELTWDGKIEKYIVSTSNCKILWSNPSDKYGIFYWDSFLGDCIKAGEDVSDQQGKLIKLIGSNNKKRYNSRIAGVYFMNSKRYYYIEIMWYNKLAKYVLDTTARDILWHSSNSASGSKYAADSFLEQCVRNDNPSGVRVCLIRKVGSDDLAVVQLETILDKL